MNLHKFTSPWFKTKIKKKKLKTIKIEWNIGGLMEKDKEQLKANNLEKVWEIKLKDVIP